MNDKKIHLIEVAEALFAEKGYTETSIRDIAKAANVNSAMISYYFGSKEKLMLSILEYRTADLQHVYSQFADEEAKDPLKSMISFVHFYIDKVFEQRYFYMLLSQLRSVGKEHLLLDYFNNLRNKNHHMIKQIYEDGVNSGVFEEGVDVSFLISTISGTVNHMMFNQSHYRIMNELEKMEDKEFLQLVIARSKAYIERLLIRNILRVANIQ